MANLMAEMASCKPGVTTGTSQAQGSGNGEPEIVLKAETWDDKRYENWPGQACENGER